MGFDLNTAKNTRLLSSHWKALCSELLLLGFYKLERERLIDPPPCNALAQRVLRGRVVWYNRKELSKNQKQGETNGQIEVEPGT
jgi:hypothetical protein